MAIKKDLNYEKVCFWIPIPFLDKILNYLESEYAIFPIEKKVKS